VIRDETRVTAEEYYDHFVSKDTIKKHRYLLSTFPVYNGYNDPKELANNWTDKIERARPFDDEEVREALWALRKCSYRKDKEYYYALEI
jgi:ribulose bisphosphate carboxylase small subunit